MGYTRNKVQEDVEVMRRSKRKKIWKKRDEENTSNGKLQIRNEKKSTKKTVSHKLERNIFHRRHNANNRALTVQYKQLQTTYYEFEMDFFLCCSSPCVKKNAVFKCEICLVQTITVYWYTVRPRKMEPESGFASTPEVKPALDEFASRSRI